MRLLRDVLVLLILAFLIIPLTAQDDEGEDDEIELSEVYDLGGGTMGGFVIAHPADWFFDTAAGLVTFTNSERLTDNPNQPLESGEIVGNITVLPAELIDGNPFGLTTRSSALEVFEALAGQLDENELQLSDAEYLDDTELVALATGSASLVTSGEDIVGDALVATFITRPGLGFIIILTPEGELPEREALLRAMLGSITPTEPAVALIPEPGDLLGGDALTQTVSSDLPDGGTVSMDYPTGWVAQAQDDGLILFATDLDTLYSQLIVPGPESASGQLMVLPDDQIFTIFEINDEITTPEGVLGAILTNNEAVEGADVQVLTSVESFVTNDKDAALLTIGFSSTDFAGDGVLIVVKEEDGFTLLSINTVRGAGEQYEDLARAMVESIAFADGE